jgi:hypothetical protein
MIEDPQAEAIYHVKDELHHIKWEEKAAVLRMDFLSAAQFRAKAMELEKRLELLCPSCPECEIELVAREGCLVCQQCGYARG